MTEIDYTYESVDLKCPYCGEFQSDSWEIDFNDNRVKIECDCGKKFWGSEHITRNYEGNPDCELNGEEHDFEEFSNRTLKCKKCGVIKLKGEQTT